MQNGLTTLSVNVDVQLESTVRGTNVNLWTHREQCNLRNKDDNV